MKPEDVVLDVLLNRDDDYIEDRAGREGTRVAIGRTAGGRYIRVIYVPEVPDDQVFVITAYERQAADGVSASAQEEMMPEKAETRFPEGWDEDRVPRALAHYESQTDDEAVAEDEAAFQKKGQTFVEIPNDLLPEVHILIAERRHEA